MLGRGGNHAHPINLLPDVSSVASSTLLRVCDVFCENDITRARGCAQCGERCSQLLGRWGSMDADAVAANFGGAQMQMCCRMVTLVAIFYVYPDTPLSIFVGARECVHEKPHACHATQALAKQMLKVKSGNLTPLGLCAELSAPIKATFPNCKGSQHC